MRVFVFKKMMNTPNWSTKKDQQRHTSQPAQSTHPHPPAHGGITLRSRSRFVHALVRMSGLDRVEKDYWS